MRRIRLTVEYDGTDYAGWQRQENAMTVQQRLEEALRRLTGEEIGVTGASRTDAGVHARGQVAHFDTESRIPAERFDYALNTLLPPDIRIRDSALAAPDFHARFQAKEKTYCYRIANAKHAPAIGRRYCAFVYPHLEEAAMHEAIQQVIGEHDFSACMASGGIAKDRVRRMYEAKVIREGEQIEFWIRGKGFLYNMVRILAGTLIGIGQGKLEADCIGRALESGDRLLLGVTAPAQGLTLESVGYDGYSSNLT